MIKTPFLWLDHWYSALYRNFLKNVPIKIYSVDNPGLRFVVNLENTELENIDFVSVNFKGKIEDEWIMCFLRDYKFEGACGPKNLSQVLSIFRKWVEENSDYQVKIPLGNNKDNCYLNQSESLSWLQDWYSSHTDGDWEHDWRIRIETCDPPGWQARINCIDTSLENKIFEPIELHTKHEWLICSYENDVFSANCSPEKLSESIEVFRSWAEQE